MGREYEAGVDKRGKQKEDKGWSGQEIRAVGEHAAGLGKIVCWGQARDGLDKRGGPE